MSYADLADLARTLGVDVPEEEHDMNVTSAIETTGAEDEAHGLNTAFVAEEDDISQSEQTTGAAAGAEGAAEEDDHTHDDTISAFCSVTGGEPSAARHLLEVT
jgi:2-keto-3-deoxy-L-rhamnonate aldolase RhmA